MVFSYILECLSMYYGFLAIILYGIAYIVEVKLDLPIYDHECPGVSHIELKRLVQKIIVEVIKLPDLFNYSVVVRPDEKYFDSYFDPKRYQELLATAVLNKIVQSYKNPLNLPSPDVYSKEFDNENDLEKDNKQFELFSSIEPESVNSSHCESLTEQPMSITIEERIEEISPIDSQENSGTFSSSMSENDETILTDYLHKHQVPLPDLSTESDTNEEEHQSLRSNGTDATWEDNWLFKSRKFKTEPSNSIGMLVPEPTEEVKALIGDKNADEVSDLSEAGSDNEYAGSDDGNTGDIPNDLIQNKRIIGGKHNLDSFENPTIKIQTPLIENLFVSSESPNFILSKVKNDEILVEQEIIKNDIPVNDIQFDTLNKRDKTLNESRVGNEAFNSVIIDKENQILLNAIEDIQVNQITDEENNNLIIEEQVQLIETTMKLPPIPAPRTTDTPPQPGSIAEREHLKWQNAAPIANNPYSVELLQKRLTERPPINCEDVRTMAEMEQLREEHARKNPKPKNNSDSVEEPQRHPTNCIDLRSMAEIEKLREECERNNAKPITTEKLQDIFKADEPSFKRFGRDYYINEAKIASGERKRRSDIQLQQRLQEEQEFDEKPIQRSKSFTEDKSLENIFAARPIQVNEDDPILEKATKIESLSTEERDFYIVPIDTILSLTSSESSVVSPNHFESFSEDSDSTRIYDLTTREKKIVRQQIPDTDFTTNTNIIEIKTEIEDSISSETNSVEIITSNNIQKKLVIPGINSKDTVKFFESKKNNLNQKKMEEENLIIDSTIIVKNKVAEMETSHENGTNEHSVIEEELINALPSVKLLAKTFSVKTEAEPLPILRPKNIAWQSSKEIGLNETDENPTEPSSDSFNPQYSQNYHPVSPGYSITGRSISKQFREELKESVNENDHQPRPVSPERSPSPVPIPGQLRNSIAFFENLKNK